MATAQVSHPAPQSVRSRSHRSFPHPRIQGECLSFSYADLVGLRVHRIDEVIPLDRNDGRGDGEHSASGGLDPGGAEIGKRRRRWIGAPAPRKAESGHTFELFDGALGKIGSNRNEVVRHRAGIEIHEVLESCEGECGGRVDDGRAAMVPPPSGESGALAVECRVLTPTHPPDTDQLWTPCAIRMRRSSTSWAPRSVSRCRSGATLPSARFG